MLYAASSLSLACLETLVHIRDTGNLPDLIYSEITIPDDPVREWRELPERTEALLQSAVLSRELGDTWLHLSSGAEVTLQVPSAVVRQEWNYLINPRHSHFPQLY
jgi:RES domain-containing protein